MLLDLLLSYGQRLASSALQILDIRAIRTKRTLRQAQLVLDRLHQEISGIQIARKTLRAYCAEWLATKEPETAPRTPSFLPYQHGKIHRISGRTCRSPRKRLNQGRYRCLSQLFG